MNIILFTILCFTLGSLLLILGSNDNDTVSNTTLKRVLKLLSVVCLFGMFVSFMLAFKSDAKTYAVSWEKSQVKVLYNQGDSKYYYLDDEGYEPIELIQFKNDFDLLKNDSAVIYKPTRFEWLGGFLHLNIDEGNKNQWIYRYNNDLVYDNLV